MYSVEELVSLRKESKLPVPIPFPQSLFFFLYSYCKSIFPRLQCIGTPLHLKQKYGRGYRLTVKAESNVEQVDQYCFSFNYFLVVFLINLFFEKGI